jgi:hypothetical protein
VFEEVRSESLQDDTRIVAVFDHVAHRLVELERWRKRVAADEMTELHNTRHVVESGRLPRKESGFAEAVGQKC